MEHVDEVVRRGLSPSGQVGLEAADYWRALDELERFRINRELGLKSGASFVDFCERRAAETRLQRANDQCYIAAFYGRGR